jgi:hypothetical protein
MNHFYRQKEVISIFFILLFFSTNLFSQNRRNSYVNPYILPLIFDGKAMDDLSIPMPESPLLKQQESLFPIEKLQIPFLDEREKRENIQRKAYRNLLSNRIDLVQFSYLDFPDELEKITEIKAPTIFQSLFKIEPEFDNNTIDRSARFVPQRKYWIINGNSLIQFSQTYISKNWYKGGVGNHNLLSVQNVTANYRKNKVQFNNFAEWRLSFFTNPNDTTRIFKIGEDLIRTYSDFGFTAFKNWAYSTNIEIKTQFFKSFRDNSTDYTSSFAAPLHITMGILGMKYQLNKTFPKDKNKRLTVSADISPLSVQYILVSDRNVNPKRFGIEEGKHHLLDFGSTINSRLVLNVNKQVSFSSRFRYFTNYEKVVIELENELNMAVLGNFSTRLYVFTRFDDSPGIVKDERLGYIQVNELLSFGLNYRW